MPRECNCAGGCGPQSGGVTRREFITLVGTGTAGVLLGSAAQAAPNAFQSRPEDLTEWKKSLTRSAPRRYRSDTHTDAQMPLGGIGTGNFEIGADGRFTTWQLFNTLRDGHVPFHFAVKAGQAAKLLQTTGGPDWPRVLGIEMTGEYPFATLRFADPDLPVHLEMTAFSPFAPLESRLSSMPLAYFVFRIHNPTAEKQTVSLAAFMQNPVGYDAVGVPISFNSVGFNAVAEQSGVEHPNFGGNVNRVYKEGRATVLAMEAVGSTPPTLDKPVTLYTNLDTRALNTPYNDRPRNLTLLPLDRLAAPTPDTQPPTPSVLWLEDASAGMSAATLRAVRDAVKEGAALVFSGREMPLLKSYAQLTGGKPLDRAALQSDIVFEDFEKGYGNWKVSGTAFGEKPPGGTLAGQQRVSGFVGKGLVNTFLNGDDTTGRLVSKDFTVERNFIRFLIGGGNHPTTQIRLIVDGKVVRALSGRNEERLIPASWDVREFRGRQAHVEIVDEQTGGWGHINIDQIAFTDLPSSVDALEVLEELLPPQIRDIRPLENGRVEFVGLEAPPNAQGSVISRSHAVGKGRVFLFNGPILEPSQAEMIGARKTAYTTLCDTVEARYTGPAGVPPDAPGSGALALATLGPGSTSLPAFENWSDAWTRFSAPDGFKPEGKPEPVPTLPGRTINGALASTVTVPPGKAVEVPFLLAWRYPNKYNGAGVSIGNHYAEEWASVDTVVREAVTNFPRLRAKTEQFRKTFYDSTLPYWLLDCLSSQISTLRHVGVVFRTKDGNVYGWEGSNGCCQPTCTHVWGYVANIARLFPELERDMRRIDYKHQQRADGGVNNRTDVPSPPHPTGEQPFADGHAGTVLKAYREALQSSSDAWLKEYWPYIKKSVEYLIGRDAATSNNEPDGTLADDQWNTYDEALHGVTTFISGYYLAALRAGEEMAKRMGDNATAQRFHTIFETGQKKLIELCWDGEYFRQNLPGYETMPGEVGPGCMSDQLIGQWWAHQLGLGYLFPKEMVVKALQSVYKYNWKTDLTGWPHSPRAFAGAMDKGLIICTWPKGGRPPHVMLYSDEVWTGIEYQVAAHMLYEGLIEEGFAIAKGARDRYNGVPRAPIPRNPWNEIECGGHYVRAGSSWTLLLAASGWRCDGMTGEVWFQPRYRPENFKSFFCGPEGWGALKQTRQGKDQMNEIVVVEGNMLVKRLNLNPVGTPQQARVTVGGKAIAATFKSTPTEIVLTPSNPISLERGEAIVVTIG